MERTTSGGFEPISIAACIRDGFDNPRLAAEFAEKLKWDASQVSRFKSGNQGVPIDKLDVLFSMLGFVPVTKDYLDNLAGLATVGSACKCARMGGGVCGVVRIGGR